MSNKRQKTGTSRTSSVRAFFSTLPSPLRTILNTIDETLEIEPPKRKWSTKDKFAITHRLLTKQGENAKDHLKVEVVAWSEVFQLAKMNPRFHYNSKRDLDFDLPSLTSIKER